MRIECCWVVLVLSSVVGCATSHTDPDSLTDGLSTGDRPPSPTPPPSSSPTPPPSSAPSGECHGFGAYDFVTRDPSPCSGDRLVRYDERYDLWVGVALCTDDTYKLYLSDARDGEYLQVGDWAGHGQDHCELVNPEFTIPNEDDITSGGCLDCATSADRSWYENPVGTAGYGRGSFGEPFERVDPWPTYNLYTVEWLACGVSFGECGPSTEPMPPPPSTPPSAPYEWSAFPFADSHVSSTSCNGARYVRFDERYQLFVGVSLCSATRYEIYLSATRDGTFLPVGDYAGNGQDHCELIDPAFRIPNEDEITSGGCTACDLDNFAFWEAVPTGAMGYSRARFGEPFQLESSWPEYNLYSATWYECGVAVP